MNLRASIPVVIREQAHFVKGFEPMAEQQKSQRGANLTQADRERGGRVSAAKQVRDARGKFAGAKKNNHRDQRQEDQEHRQNKSQHEQGG